MKSSIKKKINREVARSFPELKGVAPKVRSQGNRGDQGQYLLIYQGTAELPNGKQMKRVVRVVANESGRILRMSTSR